MEIDDYVVVRFDGPLAGPRVRLEGVGSGARDGAVPAEVKVTIEPAKLSEAQRAKEAEDPRQEVANAMEVALVAPLSGADGIVAPSVDPLAEAKAAKASWGIAATGALKSPYSGANVVVAVLDTGINAGPDNQRHPAFRGVELIRRNFTKAPELDANGHGTHCASTIFGREVEGVRVGIAPGISRALIGKVLDDKGNGSNLAVFEAMKWAQSEQANVISTSLGIDFAAMALRLETAGWPKKAAISRALKAYRDNVRIFDKLVALLATEGVSQGMVVVAAAGNETRRKAEPSLMIDVGVPAASEQVLSVGALQRSAAGLGIAPFSNINPILCAPGVDITGSDLSGGLVSLSGTSMACPHVAGLAALWWEHNVRLNGGTTASETRANLMAAAVPIPGVTRADQGVGMAMAPPPKAAGP